jgi:ferredoxin
MPTKYHIEVCETPNRFPVIGRSGIVDWGEGCLKCAECVKHECIYDAYRKRTFSSDILGDTIDEWCKNCFRCVQGCPKRLIHKTINPEWEALGDDVYTPDIICITWEQAKSGKIPVSGAGYGGAYAGPGFDSMWTDMSEIVRPTRDGIHGREYISTTIEIGRKPSMLEFDASGTLVSQPAPSVKVPLPIIFDIVPFGDLSFGVWRAFALAAARLGTRLIVRGHEANELADWGPHLIPLLEGEEWDSAWIAGLDMVEIPDSPDVMSKVEGLKQMNPDLVVSVRVPAL